MAIRLGFDQLHTIDELKTWQEIAVATVELPTAEDLNGALEFAEALIAKETAKDIVKLYEEHLVNAKNPLKFNRWLVWIIARSLSRRDGSYSNNEFLLTASRAARNGFLQDVLAQLTNQSFLYEALQD